MTVRIILLILALLPFAATGRDYCTSGLAPIAAGGGVFLKVAGTAIVDQEGCPLTLRGFQGLGAYPIPEDLFLEAVVDHGVDSLVLDPIAEDIQRYALTDFDIEEIRSTGANVVRVWTRVHEVKRGRAEYSETALKLLEQTVNRFGAQGIYTVLVMAGAGENNYEPQQRYLRRGIDLWDSRSAARADSLEVWGVLAGRFAANRHIAGYEIMNEPMPPTARALHDYYRDAIAVIRARDMHHIIILSVAQGNEVGFQIGGNYDDDNIAATFHFYEPHDFTLEPAIRGLSYPGVYRGKYWDRSAIAEIFDFALSLPQLRDKPVYVGEFGADGDRDGNGGLEWTIDVLGAMNARGLHYTYHNYRHETHRGYWTRKPEVTAVLQALQQAVAQGRLDYWSLDESTKRELFSTEAGCVRRAHMRDILTEAFSGQCNAGPLAWRAGCALGCCLTRP